MRSVTRSTKWPMLAGGLFQFGAIAQIWRIIAERDAASVSVIAWGLPAVILIGYLDFYDAHMNPEAKKFAILATSISIVLYTTIVVLTFIY